MWLISNNHLFSEDQGQATARGPFGDKLPILQVTLFSGILAYFSGTIYECPVCTRPS